MLIVEPLKLAPSSVVVTVAPLTSVALAVAVMLAVPS